MKIRFPSYTTSFSCECNLSEATTRIAEAAAWPANNLKIEKAYYSGAQNIILRSSTGSHLYFNSFLPRTSLTISEANQGILVSISFSLPKSVKVLITIYSAFATLFGVILSLFFLIHQLPFQWPLCLPFAFALFAYGLGCIGLRISLRQVLETLHYTLTQEFAKHLPSVYRR